MPTYEFTCRECRKKFQIERPISKYNSRAVRCPKCSKKNVTRIWSPVQVKTGRKS